MIFLRLASRLVSATQQHHLRTQVTHCHLRPPSRMVRTLTARPVSLAPLHAFADEPVPEAAADDAYPDWLWTMGDPLPSLHALEQTLAAHDGDILQLSPQHARRLLKLRRRRHVKSRNLTTRIKYE